jgi:glycosyltransferase involved in cell wall biosynthesis
VPKKAPLVLLESFRQARAAAPQLRLDLIGDGELFAAAQQFVREHGLAGVVTLHGAQPNDRVRELMGQADLFLQHSMTDAVSGDAEGLPVAILEAMAHALPVVSTRHEGIPEAVQDGQTGLLVAESDSAAMAHAITGLARDRALRRRMGQAGWARCVELFSWQRERDELLALMGLGD